MNIGCRLARRFLPQGACGLLLHAAFTMNVMAAQIELPPLSEPASAEHHVGKVIWADLVTPDLAGARRFYSGLFGWTYRDIHGGDRDYAVALLDGRPVAGLLQRVIAPGEHRQPAWLTFIADPTGAPVGLMEWSANDSKEEPK